MNSMSQSSPPITVAHVVFRFDYGGMENGIVNLINNSDPALFKHVVIALSEVTDFADRIIPGRAEFVSLNKQPGKDFPMYGRLFKALRRIRPDIYHSRNFGTIDTVPFARAAGVGTCIHGEHGWDVHDPDGTLRKYQWIRKIVSPFITQFMTVSIQLQDWLTCVVGIKRRKVTHICNGVDTEKFIPAGDAFDRSTLLPKEIFPDDAIIIGAVGRFEKIKDPLNLVDAFIKLASEDAEDRRKLRLLYVGGGALRQSALDRLESAGFANRAWLPGSRDDVPALFHCMDLFVLPSLREGISNTILEAMASGLPVIATGTGGNVELVDHGETGALVPVSDSKALASAIRVYTDDPAHRKAHAVTARNVATQRLSLSAMINNYEALYLSAIKN